MSRCVNILGARVLTVEEGMCKYGMEESKEQSFEIDLESEVPVKLMISTLILCVYISIL